MNSALRTAILNAKLKICQKTNIDAAIKEHQKRCFSEVNFEVKVPHGVLIL